MTQTTLPQAKTFRWAFLPIVLIALAYLAVAIRSELPRLRHPWPKSPWEAAIVVDAWRVVHGQSAYTDPATGHATHMYGPLATYSAAPFVWIAGADPRIPRLITFFSVIALSLVAAFVISRPGDWFIRVLIGSICFLQFYRAAHYSSEGRPDAIALLFAMIALLLFYRSAIEASPLATRFMIFGTAVMILGFLFKQPVMIISVIPLIATIVQQSTRSVWRIKLAMIPIAVAGLTVLSLRLFWPWVYFYMARVPAKYPVPWPETKDAMVEIIGLKSEWFGFRGGTPGFNGFFVVSMVVWLIFLAFTRTRKTLDSINIWLLVISIITAVGAIAARAKPGGWFNSYLPMLLAMSMLSVRVLSMIFDHISLLRWRWFVGVPISLIIGLALVIDMRAISRDKYNPGPVVQQKGDSSYLRVIAAVKKLPGTVISPDDPTVALRAKGYAGRSGDCEMDAYPQNGKRAMPSFALAELDTADWVIQLTDSRATRRPTVMSDKNLQLRGFEPQEGVFPPRSSYVLWKRVEHPTTAPASSPSI